MAYGDFTNKSRVERDGYLVAFEGEVMSADEAAKRGLLGCAEDVVCEACPETKTDLETLAASLSVEVADSDTRAGIEEKIIEKRGGIEADPEELTIAAGASDSLTVSNYFGCLKVVVPDDSGLTAAVTGNTVSVSAADDATTGEVEMVISDRSLNGQSIDVVVTVTA